MNIDSIVYAEYDSEYFSYIDVEGNVGKIEFTEDRLNSFKTSGYFVDSQYIIRFRNLIGVKLEDLKG